MKNVMRFLSAFAALSFSSLYAVSQESAAFLEPTVVTVVEKTTGNDIKDGNKETAWCIDAGTDAQDNDDYYLFWPSNVISMRETFNIGNYTSFEINLPVLRFLVDKLSSLTDFKSNESCEAIL